MMRGLIVSVFTRSSSTKSEADLLIDVQKFRIFLESISGVDSSSARSRKCTILLEFLNSDATEDEDDQVPSLSGLIQAWSFAAQASIDAQLSGIPDVIALLLRTISNLIEFRDFGVRLCKALLQKEQVKLFDRGLTAWKAREHLVAPCLRLLTEIVAFDGGSCARRLYAQRDVTFKRLEAFLGMRQYHDDKAFLRSTAVPYLLANLQFQDKNVKSDILTQSRIVRALFHDIKDDPPDVVVQILKIVKESIVINDALPRASKSRLLTDTTLAQIAAVYQYQDKLDSNRGDSSVVGIAHEFLLSACTTLDQGVLIKQNGWYPPSVEPAQAELKFHEPSYASYSIDKADANHVGRLTVRNTTLASFLQHLRPYGNVHDRELVLAIFESAPELVADYFLKRSSFSFDPKLTATWIGFSSFLFSVIQLDVPNHGRHTEESDHQPPPVSIALESILPQPLSQKSLTKCLNQSSDLMRFFVLRLLIAAFKKLQKVLSMWHTDHDDPRWKHAAQSLKSRFCQRCPELSHVIAAFRSCADTKHMQKEALSRLLSLYYKITPHIALQEKFDISVMLADELSRNADGDIGGDDLHTSSLKLDNLLDIACRAPDMNWWQKPGTCKTDATNAL